MLNQLVNEVNRKQEFFLKSRFFSFYFRKKSNFHIIWEMKKRKKKLFYFFDIDTRNVLKMPKRTVFCYFGHGKSYFFTCDIQNYFSINHRFFKKFRTKTLFPNLQSHFLTPRITIWEFFFDIHVIVWHFHR
jgi:hypothetical protein